MEQKYKVWDKKTKKIRKIHSIAFDDEGNIKLVNMWGTDIIEQKDIVIKREKDYELLPYTGANDINKEEIYKGDICKDDIGTVVQIVWVEDHFQYGAKIIKGSTLTEGLTFPLWQWNGCKENGYRRLERIGNIYTDPNMIRKEE